MIDWTQLLGVMTVFFFVVLIAQAYIGWDALWLPSRIGLVGVGAPWLAVILSQLSGASQIWVIPAVYAVAFLYWTRGFWRRRWEDVWIRLRGEWRCRECGKINEAVATVCYYCRAWRP